MTTIDPTPANTITTDNGGQYPTPKRLFVPWMPKYTMEDFKKFERKIKAILHEYDVALRKAGVKL